MKAIILNSGTASRMEELVATKPKCLLEVERNQTVLGLQLYGLQEFGIEEIIITTGLFEEKIKSFVAGFIADNFNGLKVQYVNNPLYTSTNYIYSLFLAREAIREDQRELLLLHGDLVFEKKILQQIMYDRSQNAVLLDRSIPPPEKDFKGRVVDGLVQEIGVKVRGENCYFLAPLYKFSFEAFNVWLEEIEKFIARGEAQVYAENAFNEVSSQLGVKPVFYDGSFCMEIDTPDDLQTARDYFKEK